MSAELQHGLAIAAIIVAFFYGMSLVIRALDDGEK